MRQRRHIRLCYWYSPDTTIRIDLPVQDALGSENTALPHDMNKSVVMERLTCLAIELHLRAPADLAQTGPIPPAIRRLFDKMVVPCASTITFEIIYNLDTSWSGGDLPTNSDIDATVRPSIEELFHYFQERRTPNGEPHLPQSAKLVIRAIPERPPGQSADLPSDPSGGEVWRGPSARTRPQLWRRPINLFGSV